MNLQKQLRNHNLAWKISPHVVRKTPPKGIPNAGKAISTPYWNIRIKFQSKSQKTLIILNKITSLWEPFRVVYNQTTKAHRNSTCKHTFSRKPNGLNVKNTAAHPPQTISHTHEKIQVKDQHKQQWKTAINYTKTAALNCDLRWTISKNNESILTKHD